MCTSNLDIGTVELYSCIFLCTGNTQLDHAVSPSRGYLAKKSMVKYVASLSSLQILVGPLPNLPDRPYPVPKDRAIVDGDEVLCVAQYVYEQRGYTNHFVLSHCSLS